MEEYDGNNNTLNKEGYLILCSLMNCLMGERINSLQNYVINALRPRIPARS